ncbi:hypothetical protein [Actinoallomurus acanthiterrae]
MTRFAIPDASGGGIDSTLDAYGDGTFLKAIDLPSSGLTHADIGI